MRVRLVWAVVAMLLLALSSIVVPGTLLETADAQSELDRARERVRDTTARLEGLLAEVEVVQQRGDQLAGEYWQVGSSLEKLTTEISETEAAEETLDQQRSALQVEVRDIALDQYVSRSEDLTAGDFESEADRAAAETLARLVVGSDTAAIDQLAVVDAEYAVTRQQLEEQRNEQRDIQQEVQATQAGVFDELERLAGLREDLDGELAALEDALAELEQVEVDRQAAAEQARIAEERRRAAEVAAAVAAQARQVPTPAPTPSPVPTVPNPQLPEVTPSPVPTVPNPQLPEVTPSPVPTVPNPQPSTSVSSGGIVCPLAGSFTHTDDFNAPRAVGGIHRANDLIAAQGTPVLAAASGTVDHRSSSVGGLSAHLKGDNGDYYFYTHLSGYENVGAGHVTAGTVIGYVGMTGNAPIPHLHFEIHTGGYGNYANPYGPVRAACF